MRGTGEITRLLQASRSGDEKALNEVLRQMYAALHQLAASQLHANHSERTLSATALVNEAYLRVFEGQNTPDWESRMHLMGIAAHAMRQVLIDSARRRKAAKRPQDVGRFSLTEVESDLAQDVDPNALDVVLDKLESIDARQAKIVEMRFFVGLNAEEIGALLGISAATVQREWRMARAWLLRELDIKADT
ncbi:MAG TPA: ECF-type sigma factor [Rhodanobacteraceae bacterium]|jgi:RNA polymerase sigma factor (TIGR02999 family)|nr:ECF-type sigma factor [Rhodanobacteraceae bacterium]